MEFAAKKGPLINLIMNEQYKGKKGLIDLTSQHGLVSPVEVEVDHEAACIRRSAIPSSPADTG
jgi:hypothetical protein